MIRFGCALLAVEDIERAKQFYIDLFDQQVVLDFGANVTMSGGFALQAEFAWLTNQAPEAVKPGAGRDFELYFETDDLDRFLARLQVYPEVRLLHPPKTYDWLQRVVRLFDPDGHIIEVGEAMSEVFARCLRQGMSPAQTAQATQHPLEMVEETARSLGMLKETGADSN